MTSEYNLRNIWRFGFDISLGMFITGFNQGVFNTSMDVIADTLGWGDQTQTYQAVFSAFNPVGSIFGALLSGVLANRKGRRWTFIFWTLFGMGSTVISVIPETVTFGVGRFLMGIVSGAYLVVSPMIISETIPPALFAKVGATCQFSFTVGMTISFAVGLPLPTSDYKSSPMSYWWIFMFGCQILVFVYMLLTQCLKYTFDTPYYTHLRQGDTSVPLKYIYQEDHVESFIENLKSAEEDIGTESLSQMCCTRKYCRMIRLGLSMSALVAWSGAIAIVFYSTSLFGQLGGGVLMSRVYTVVVGAVNIAAVMTAMTFINRFGRRKLIIGGEIGIVIVLGTLSIVTWLDIGGVVLPLLLIILFLVVFQSGPGSLNWMYTGEVTTDNIMGFAIASCCINLSLVTLTFPFLVDGLGISGSFLVYASITAVAAVYMSIDMVETHGLTKAQIYSKVTKS